MRIGRKQNTLGILKNSYFPLPPFSAGIIKDILTSLFWQFGGTSSCKHQQTCPPLKKTWPSGGHTQSPPVVTYSLFSYQVLALATSDPVKLWFFVFIWFSSFQGICLPYDKSCLMDLGRVADFHVDQLFLVVRIGVTFSEILTCQKLDMTFFIFQAWFLSRIRMGLSQTGHYS